MVTLNGSLLGVSMETFVYVFSNGFGVINNIRDSTTWALRKKHAGQKQDNKRQLSLNEVVEVIFGKDPSLMDIFLPI